MDILMIVLSVMGLGFLTVGSGALVKDATTKMITDSDTKPNPKAVLNLKKFLRVLGTYLLVYVCLNIVTLLVFLLIGQVEKLNSLRTMFIECNLLLSLPITWLIIKRYRQENEGTTY